MKELTGAQILLECLKRAEVKDIFGYPGGTVIPIFDALYHDEGSFNFYMPRHEQGGAHMADAYARERGLGVCIGTSGPGAVNLTTGIMTAYMDSSPLLAITGQVNLSLVGTDAFQESDIVGIVQPVTKYSYLVTKIEDIPRVIRGAIHVATTGRQGPVLIDIPKDIQLQTLSFEKFEELYAVPLNIVSYKPVLEYGDENIPKVISLLNESEKPLILAGAGVIKSKSREIVSALAKKIDAPICTTLLGVGTIDEGEALSLGMAGMHGTVASNLALSECDTVLVAGSRFDDRLTGKLATFLPKAKIIHIDIDAAEIDKNKRSDIHIVGNLNKVLPPILENVKESKHPDWIEKLTKIKEKNPVPRLKGKEGKMQPFEIFDFINSFIQGKEVNIATDVGQNQMWSALYFNFNQKTHFASSGGAGTMGYGLPASIGMAIANPHCPTIGIVGDGGVQMTSQELLLLKQFNIPVKLFIFNNSYLGMVRQWQDLFLGKRYSSVDLSLNPDFVKLADAYGVDAIRIKSKEDLEKNRALITDPKKPVVIDCVIERESQVYPMIPAGQSVSEILTGEE